MWLTILGVYLIIGGIFGAYLVGRADAEGKPASFVIQATLIGVFLWLPLGIAAVYDKYPFLRRK